MGRMRWKETVMGDYSGATTATARIDWRDVRFGILVGVVTIVIKLLNKMIPAWQIGNLDALVASILCVCYIVFRARTEPAKLDSWGLTTPLTLPSLATAFLLLLIAVGVQAVSGMAVGSKLEFPVSFIPDMVRYIPGAFPQQFFMCSVGLATLLTFPVFQSHWRLPLVVGLVFSLAHFWTPAKLPGTIIPVQMLTTFPAGFVATYYFLKYRSIVPLTVIHAIVYVLGYRWVETHL